MRVNDIFIQGCDVYKAKLPVALFVRAIYTPDVMTKDIPVSVLNDELNSRGEFVTPILVRQNKSNYEVIYGWHLVQVFDIWSKGVPDALMNVYLCNYDDRDAVRVGLRYFAEDFEVHRIHFAEKLQSVKDQYQITDSQLAEWLGDGYSRATVNNTLRLLKLGQKARALYLDGVFKNSVAKMLCAMPHSEQNDLLARFSGCAKITWDDIKPAEPTPSNRSVSQVAIVPKKSMDILRTERDLSDLVGAPIEIRTLNSEEIIEVKFFSRDELENVLEKMFDSKTVGGKVSGALTLSFVSMSDLNDFISPLFEEDF